MKNQQFQLSEAQAPRLTKWENEPTIQALKADLEASKSAHDDQVLKINRWTDLIQVKGSAKPREVKGRSKVQPKLIRRQAEWRYSALSEPFLGSNKLFKVSPTTFEDGDGARQNELVINTQFRTQLNRVKFIDDYVRSTVDEGTSIIQVGWHRVTAEVEQEVPVWAYFPITTPEQGQLLQQALAAKQADRRHYEEQCPPELCAAVDYYEETQKPVFAQQRGTTKVKVEQVIENRPTVKLLDPRNVYIDPSCEGDLDKAQFIAVSFETCRADLLKAPKGRYKNLDRVNWETNTPLAQPDHETQTPQTFAFQDKSRKKVVAYEYWGMYPVNGDDEPLVPIVATWIGDVLIRMELNPFPDQKLPFILVPYLPVKRSPYGEPDAELLEDNQAILGAVTRGMIDLLGRSANGQQGFAKGMLDPLNRRRFDEGRDYEFNPNVSPQLGHIEHKYPELPQSALLMLNLQNQEAEALTGVKAFAGGISGEALGDVAAAIKGVLDAASKREMAILRRLAKGICDLGVKMISMNQAFLSEEETVRITNREFITVKREDIQGQFDLEVDISTAEIDAAKAQDLAFMLQTMGPNLDLGINLLILSEIAELKKMPELAEKIRTFKPDVDPLAEELKRLQVEELRFKVEELRTKAELNRAKAQEASAKADITNLDFVEQETGTKHERDLEKQRAQSQGNKDLQVTKALTTPRKEGEGRPDIEAAIGFNALTKDTRKDDPQIGFNSNGNGLDPASTQGELGVPFPA